MKKYHRGFTITELVIVLAAAAILAAIIIPTFAGVIGKADSAADAISSRQTKIQNIIDGGAPEQTTAQESNPPAQTEIELSSGGILDTPGVTYTYSTAETVGEVTFEIGDTSIHRLVIDAPNVQSIYIKYKDGASGEAQIGYVDILHTAQTSTHIHTTVLQLNVADGRAVVESDADVRAVDISPSENATATVELYSGTNEISANYKYHAGSSGDHINLIDYTGACNVTVCADDEAVENGTTTTITLKSTTSTPVAISVSADYESAESFFESAQITVKVTVNEEEQTSFITAITPSVSAVTLDFETLELNVGGSSTLTAGLLPGGASGDIEWETSDSSVATVSNGTVTAVGLGRATITATVQGVSAECTVHVGAASIGDTYYATFDEAKSAAVAEDTLVLHKNLSISSKLTFGKTLTLDLNGKTITAAATIVINSTGGNTLTISDSSGNNSGTINSSVHAIEIKSGCSLIVNGGTITAMSTSKYAIYNNGGTLAVNGGVITGNLYGIYQVGGTSTINGGDITGGTDGIKTSGSVTITGGTISGSSKGINQTQNKTITMSGGSVTSDGTGIYSQSGEVWLSGTSTVTGGTAAVNVKTDYLMENTGTVVGEIKTHK